MSFIFFNQRRLRTMLKGNFATRCALASVFVFMLFVVSPAEADLIYSDFSSSAGLTLNGVATAPATGNVLRLTATNTFNAAGTAWFNTKQDVQFGFDTTFQFRISPGTSFSTQSSADGFTFMIQNSGLNEIGAAGDGIGYGGIANSVAIEFDTFCNSPDAANCLNSGNNINDPNGNHISVLTRGTEANIQQEQNSLGSTTNIPVLDNAQVYTARILYVPGTLSIFIDNVPTLTVPLDLATKLSLDSGRAYLGFTSGTGVATANHDILNWSSTSNSVAAVPEPSTLVLLFSGLLVAGWMRNRKRSVGVSQKLTARCTNFKESQRMNRRSIPLTWLITYLMAAPFLFATPAQAVTLWTDWTSATPGDSAGSATGSVGGVGVSYSGELDFAVLNGTDFSWNPVTSFTGGTVTASPDVVRDSISLNGFVAGTNIINLVTNTITFASPQENPLVAIWSLGNPSNPATFTFNKTPTLEAGGPNSSFGGSSITVLGNVVSGVEGNGVVQFTGTFSSISWIGTPENYYSFTVGINGPLGNGTSTVPEPTSLTLFCAGAGLLGLVARLRKRG
jgi:hypothetical protein